MKNLWKALIPGAIALALAVGTGGAASATVACTTPITNPAPLAQLPAGDDHREYQHGVTFVTLGGRTLLVWSSNGGNPPKPPSSGNWVDDVYYSYVDACNPAGSFTPATLFSAPRAQEPASAAVNSADHMLVTTEDARYHPELLDQTFGVWDNALGIVKAPGQKLMPPQGGHSGHVAASGDKFLVSFSDGWVDGGGVDNNGTGDDVFGKVVSSSGTPGTLINTAVGGSHRDWWPIVAGSDTNFLQVWQRYGGVAGTGGGKVLGAIISQSGTIVKNNIVLFTNDKYYYHDVQYVPSLGLYLVVGSQNVATNSGIAVLVDKAGNVVSTTTGLPNTVREARTVISPDGATAVYAGGPGAVVLNVTATGVTLNRTLPLNWHWDYMGTDGVFAGSRVVFATGSQAGIKFLTVDLG